MKNKLHMSQSKSSSITGSKGPKSPDFVVHFIIIVDENTGRLMTGRRWSEGLHQAVEAKEGVDIERETQTLATITIQNYFRLYEKLGKWQELVAMYEQDLLQTSDREQQISTLNKIAVLLEDRLSDLDPHALLRFRRRGPQVRSQNKLLVLP